MGAVGHFFRENQATIIQKVLKCKAMYGTFLQIERQLSLKNERLPPINLAKICFSHIAIKRAKPLCIGRRRHRKPEFLRPPRDAQKRPNDLHVVVPRVDGGFICEAKNFSHSSIGISDTGADEGAWERVSTFLPETEFT